MRADGLRPLAALVGTALTVIGVASSAPPQPAGGGLHARAGQPGLLRSAPAEQRRALSGPAVEPGGGDDAPAPGAPAPPILVAAVPPGSGPTVIELAPPRGIRTVLFVPPPSAPRPSLAQVQSAIVGAAQAHGLEPAKLLALAECESGQSPFSIEPHGHYGLFQFLPSTFAANGGRNLWDYADQAAITAAMIAHGQAWEWACAGPAGLLPQPPPPPVPPPPSPPPPPPATGAVPPPQSTTTTTSTTTSPTPPPSSSPHP